jgi:hypothetical protein
MRGPPPQIAPVRGPPCGLGALIGAPDPHSPENHGGQRGLFESFLLTILSREISIET